jgi:hypothetical protein
MTVQSRVNAIARLLPALPPASSVSVRNFEQPAGLHRALVAPSGVERPAPFAEHRQPALGDRVFDFRAVFLQRPSRPVAPAPRQS